MKCEQDDEILDMECEEEDERLDQNLNYEKIINFLKNKNYEKNPDSSLYSNFPYKTQKINIDREVTIGKWSPTEDQIILDNWKIFLKDYPELIGSEQVIFNPVKWDCNLEVRRFIRQTNLYERLGKGINRFVENIYWRAKRKIFRKTKGTATKKDIKKIEHLYKINGPRWTQISAQLNLKPDSIREIYMRNTKTYSSKKWSKSEERNLTRAIFQIKQLGNCLPQNSNTLKKKKINKHFIKSILDSDFRYISWKDVSNLVKTRSPIQCRIQWFQRLLPKFIQFPDIMANLYRKNSASCLPEFAGSDGNDLSDGTLGDTKESSKNDAEDESEVVKDTITPKSVKNENRKKMKITEKNVNDYEDDTSVNRENIITAKLGKTEDDDVIYVQENSYMTRKIKAVNAEFKAALLVTLKEMKGKFTHEARVDWNLVKDHMGRKDYEIPSLQRMFRQMKRQCIKTGHLQMSQLNEENNQNDPKNNNLIATDYKAVSAWIDKHMSFDDIVHVMRKKYKNLLKYWNRTCIPV
ncbi:unnamed protein product [Gordionus sp. m RMFG-2023]|uniref:uncharacterized protein LOC135931636 n=1 Tax=Gordionus sp. m RMFG-2023 TaxID=3053472 RepID=UPI0030E12EE1